MRIIDKHQFYFIEILFLQLGKVRIIMVVFIKQVFPAFSSRQLHGAHVSRIDEVLRFKSNMDSGMFLPVQLAAVRALSLGQDWYDQLNEVYKRRRELARELVEDVLNCDVSTSQAGMFLWARIPKEYLTSFELSDEVLYTSKVFITPGGIFGSAGEQYIRVSLCSPEEKFRAALERIKTTMKKEQTI